MAEMTIEEIAAAARIRENALKEAADWHLRRAKHTPDVFERELHEKSAQAILNLVHGIEDDPAGLKALDGSILQTARVELAKLDDCETNHFILHYADTDVSDEHFGGFGAEACAHQRFEQQRSAWTCTLYKAIRFSPPDREHVQPNAQSARISELESAKRWQEAVERWFIVWHQVPDETDPYEQICNILAWEHKVALDPAVSPEAARLHGRIAELEAELARVREKASSFLQSFDRQLAAAIEYEKQCKKPGEILASTWGLQNIHFADLVESFRTALKGQTHD